MYCMWGIQKDIRRTLTEPKLKEVSHRPRPPPPECSVTVVGRPAGWMPGQGEKGHARTEPGSRTKLGEDRAGNISPARVPLPGEIP